MQRVPKSSSGHWTPAAYALLQSTLNIGGTGKIGGMDWDIHFENLSEPPTITGKAGATVKEFKATLFKFAVELYQPLDAVEYTFDVVNEGSLDASLGSIVLIGEEELNDITYTLTDQDGNSLKIGDVLKSGEKKNLKLVVSYDDVNSITNSNDIDSEIGVTLVYVQYDEEASVDNAG